MLAKYSGNPNSDTTIVNDLSAKITQATLPTGLQVHLAGQIAIQVDQQHAERSLAFARALQLLVQAREQVRAVVRERLGVGDGLALELGGDDRLGRGLR